MSIPGEKRGALTGAKAAMSPTSVLLVGLACVPFVYLLFVLVRYHLDAPYWDQWELPVLLQKSYRGTLAFSDLWAQHNEHRILFPKVIMLVLARLTHWSIGFELATSVVLAGGIFAAIMFQFGTAKVPVIWVAPLVSMLVFSVSQWQNWFLGWQLVEYLNVLAVVAGFALIMRPEVRWRHWVGAMVLGVVAAYSFADGLAFWPIGLLGLALAPGAGGRARKWARCGLWAAAGMAVIGLYFYRYEKPSYHPSVIAALAHPVEFLSYVLKYLGAPVVAYSNGGAILAGALGVAVFVALAVLTARESGGWRPAAGFCLLLGLYAGASAVMTGIARVGFGSDQALSSRYITLSTLLWIADAWFAYLVFWGGNRRARQVGAGIAVVFVFLLAVNSAYGTYRWTERYAFWLPAQAELMTGNNLDLLQRLHPKPEVVIERREILREYGLSIFRDRDRAGK